MNIFKKRKDFNPAVPQIPILLSKCVAWVAENAVKQDLTWKVYSESLELTPGFKKSERPSTKASTST